MRISRRDMLGLLATSPLAAGGCCLHSYPESKVSRAEAGAREIRPILAPKPREGRADNHRVIDVHAHFFNASDVPVRGFVVECIGHSAPPEVQRFIKYLGPIADRLASWAPTAADEITWLGTLVSATSELRLEDAQAAAQVVMRQQRVTTAERVADVIRGSRFEKEFRQLTVPGITRSSQGGTSADDVLAIVSASETPADRSAGTVDPAGVMRFLYYFLSYRACNVDAYIGAFCRHQGSVGVDMVLGSLVDFDYWLDCPPLSSHDDQVELLKLLVSLHGNFLRPVVAYNPWTDIKQNGAGLSRVEKAKKCGFVAAKIYPPTGFMPAENANYYPRGKRHPNLADLDTTLKAFFDTCASIQMPVIAHAEQKNGRDQHHDDFSSPTAWGRLLSQYSSSSQAPVINVGHFGGGSNANNWTKGFADLMSRYNDARLFGDLGYWPELICRSNAEQPCIDAKNRLKDVLGKAIGTTGETIADRVMFGSDWLMLSQVGKWAEYPARVHAALDEIASPDAVAKIFGGNARRCFSL